MSSPSGSLGRSSRSPSSSPRALPKRHPLHERSPSRANELMRPSIRVIEDDTVSAAYFKSPFPSHPAHILRPHNAPASMFEDQDRRVSAASSIANTVSSSAVRDNALVPSPLQPRKSASNRQSTSTRYSEVDTLHTTSGSPFTPSSSRFSAVSTPPSSVALADDDFLEHVVGTAAESKVRDPSSSIRLVAPDAPSSSPSPSLTPQSHGTRRLTEHRSDSSLASTISDVITIHRPGDALDVPLSSPPSSPNFVVHSDRRNDTSNASPSPPSSAPSSSDNGDDTVIHHEVDPLDRSNSTSTSDSDRPRSLSTPSHITIRRAEGAPIQYPTVRPPPASSAWASSPAVAQRPPRMNHASLRSQWSPHLSAIPSETESRPSRSMSISYGSNGSPVSPEILSRELSVSSIRRVRAQSESSSSRPPSSIVDYSMASVVAPAPLFSPQPLASSSTIPSGRDSEERDDRISDLPGPQPLRPQRSGYLKRYSDISRPTSAGSTNSSAPSIIASALPAWARAYYRGSVSLPPSSSHSNVAYPRSPQLEPTVSLHRQPSTTVTITREPTNASARSSSPGSSHFPLSIFHPRKRPRQPDRRAAAGLSSASATGGALPPLPATPEPEERAPRSLLRRTKRLPIISRGARMSSRQESPLPPSSPIPSPPFSRRIAGGASSPPVSVDVSIAEPDPVQLARTARYTALSLRPPQAQYLSGVPAGLNINSPRLPRDRRTAGRMSVWVAPSLDESLGPRVVFGPVGRQITCFAVGFVLFPAWYVGALMPLPTRPLARLDLEATGPEAALAGLEGRTDASAERPRDRVKTEGSDVEVEDATGAHPGIQQALVLRIDAYEEAQYLKARWWRNLNRLMCVVGLLLIGVIIALAVVGSKMRGKW